MAPRLPTPGGDPGNWGKVLNEFLSVEHQSDGTLNPSGTISLKYTKPDEGIPKSDLDTATQASLDKADVSLNEIQVKSAVATDLATPGSDSRSAVDRPIVRGLSDPNPGIARLHPLSGVMSDPPVITFGASGAASVITGSRRVMPDDPAFTYIGAFAETFGANYPTDTAYSTSHSRTNGLITVASEWGVEFEWYGSAFELFMHGGGAAAKYRLTVNDEGYDVREGRSDLPNTGGLYKIHYDFGTAAFRRIRFNFTNSVRMFGVYIGPNDSIWPTHRPLGPKVIVTGDSFSEGSFLHWPAVMGELLGWTDLTTPGKGSTGYLDESTGDDTYRDRVQKDIIDWNPDIVMVSGGINDSGNLNPSAVGAEAGLLYDTIKAGLPDCTLIVSGMQFKSGTLSETQLRVAFAIRDAALASSAVNLYIDQLGLGTAAFSGTPGDYTDAGWMTGTGRVGSTTGVGNSDIFTSSDSTHPTQLGHDYRGYRHADAISAAMPL